MNAADKTDSCMQP